MNKNSEKVVFTKNLNEFIVKSNQSIGQKLLVYGISLIMWFHMFTVFYFFISALFDYNDSFIGILKSYFKITNSDIRYFMVISVIYFVFSFLILFSWKMYNKKRYGSLNRRKDPGPTTEKEMLDLELIDPEIYTILQENDIIIFEENPVKELSRRK
ncbi:PgaD family protein [Clostridium sp. SHJSY1]|uniref:hypothetical protein n=1 Tax=Clostridium sp. SHJSY1 TaxID=2942483 RepID=UPI0028752AE8|nr:hypothetical protein [Clostridium sp. SHJSY1]MDS0524583.1 PgaD family protein [Clostridium sp. SHJSY1]